MNELISLTQSAINDELVQTVNARELHSFLGNGDMFANWIKNRRVWIVLSVRAVKPRPSGRGYKARTDNTNFPV